MNFIYREQGSHVMSWRSQWTLDNPIRGMLQSPQKMFGHMVKPGMTVVETGCGTGFFTMALACMVGLTGKVIAVDIQAEALAKLEEKVERAGLHRQVETWKCEADDIGVLPKADFVLSAYMAHEVPDISAYFCRMAQCIKRNCRMLLAEPKFHVSSSSYNEEVAAAIRAGFELDKLPSIFLSHAAVLRRG
nr:class I SAM-dependent methyltransferase [uncultured Pseudodesulfovibrio sp.]